MPQFPRRTFRSVIAVAIALSLSACQALSSQSGHEESPLSFDSIPNTKIPRTRVVEVANATGMPHAVEKALPTQRTSFECATELPLDKRVGQLMLPLTTQLELSKAEGLASRGYLGGVVVLGSPDVSIQGDIARYQKNSLYGPGIVAVDEEGGRVQRLSEITSKMPSARHVALTLGPEEARELAANHATRIGDIGFTMNLAPVADIDHNKAIGDRAYSNDADVVTAFALATADGILDAGLVPVIKHFPGHGRGSDSHHGLPVIPAVEILRESDLLPFVAASKRKDVPIMVGHLVVAGLTDGLPASISKAAVDGLLRQELGFEGLVMTDALNMSAIAESLNDAEAAELSLAAGVDLVMLSSLDDAMPVLERVVESVTSGRISDQSITESFLRVMQTRAIDVCDLLNTPL